MSTSRPSPGALATAYRDLAEQGAEEVLSVHLSGQLSGTLDAVRAGSGTAAVPVTALDSGTMAMAQGLAVAAGLAAARAGGSLEAVRRAVESSVEESRLLFYVPTLEAIGRSGRIPRGLSTVGQMFQIKPIGTVSEGRLKYVERPRQEAAAVRRLQELVVQEVGRCLDLDSSGAVLAVQEFFGRSLAEKVVSAVLDRYGRQRVRTVFSPLPPALAVHAGLGTVAFTAAPARAAGELGTFGGDSPDDTRPHGGSGPDGGVGPGLLHRR